MLVDGTHSYPFTGTQPSRQGTPGNINHGLDFWRSVNVQTTTWYAITRLNSFLLGLDGPNLDRQPASFAPEVGHQMRPHHVPPPTPVEDRDFASHLYLCVFVPGAVAFIAYLDEFAICCSSLVSQSVVTVFVPYQVYLYHRMKNQDGHWVYRCLWYV